MLSPLLVDGMLVAASMVILVRRRAGLLPWTGLVLGIAASDQLIADQRLGHR